MTMQKRTYPAIDLFKLLFMLLIVLHHSGCFANILKRGYIGVEYFFMVSGFLIAKTAMESPHMGVLGYTKRRFVKLYPHYLFSFVVMFLGTYTFRGQLNFHTFLAHIPEVLLLQNLFIQFGGVNYPCWYLSVLFYSSIFIFWLLKKSSFKVIAISGTIISTLTFVYMAIAYGKLETFATILIFYLPFWRGLSELLIGVILYRISVKLEEKIYKTYNLSFRIIEICTSVLITAFLFIPGKWDFLELLLIALLVVSITSPYSLFIIADTSVWIRTGIRYEYSVFLNHAFVIGLLGKLLFDRVAVPGIMAALIVVSCTFVYSVCISKFVDLIQAGVKNRFGMRIKA